MATGTRVSYGLFFSPVSRVPITIDLILMDNIIKAHAHPLAVFETSLINEIELSSFLLPNRRYVGILHNVSGHGKLFIINGKSDDSFFHPYAE